MTDDRNGGGIPPIPEPAAPPPLAATPPPVVPPQPAPQPAPPYYPPAAGSRTGMWVMFIILAFAAGVGGTILTLWLTGELWNSRSSYTAPSYGSGSGTGTSTYGSTPSRPSTTGGAYPPTEMSIIGTWGENCPGSRREAVTFYADHSVIGDDDRGSWSLSGSYLTARTSRETTVLYWEMINNDTARVRRSASNDTRIINRCP